MKGCQFEHKWKSSQNALWWVDMSPMMLTWKFESWDNIKFEVYTLSTFIWNRVWKIDRKWKDVNLSIGENQVKMPYGG